MPTSTTKSGSGNNSVAPLIREARVVFWDFDGVIKETVHLKGEVFARLFKAHGETLVAKIREHHTWHGGVSRLEKIPLYLSWAGLPQDPASVREFCGAFSRVVVQRVVKAPWVPGVEKILRKNPFQQKFFLVTATPQKEMETILATINLTGSFDGVFGAPTTKIEAIQKVMATSHAFLGRCLLIGDSLADQKAAAAANIPFLLREHSDNCGLPWQPSLPRIPNFLNL